MNKMEKRIGPLAPAVVVTGATEGIGRALAEEFASHGHALLLVARDGRRLADVASDLKAAHGVEVGVVASDLSTVEGCARVEETLRCLGFYADVLVNDAALLTAGFFFDQDLSKVRRLVDLNVRAVVDLTLRFLPGMIARGRGGILNVASVEAFMPVPYHATYAATKAFMRSFSRSLAYEAAGSGVRISMVAPGPIATGIHAKAGAENSFYVRLLPVMSAEKMAQIAYRRFMRGEKRIVAGWFNRLTAFGAHFVPDFILLPIMDLLFKVRDADGNAASTPVRGISEHASHQSR
jgi:uncharacterized protein